MSSCVIMLKNGNEEAAILVQVAAKLLRDKYTAWSENPTDAERHFYGPNMLFGTRLWNINLV